jgi:hypothetical protein
VYRDSEGRTRRESERQGMAAGPVFFQRVEPPPEGGVGIVGGMAGADAPGQPGRFHPQTLISDPVAGMLYVLDPDAHTAQKLSASMTPMQDPSIAAAVERAKKEFASTGRASINLNEGGKSVVIGMSRATGERSPVDQITESLGNETIEGVDCEGTRSTLTIPAGQIGNELPIVITSERWYSPKLQTVVLSKRHDPRIGDTTFKLVGISQSEPPASLFQVPADYDVIVDIKAGK